MLLSTKHKTLNKFLRLTKAFLSTWSPSTRWRGKTRHCYTCEHL